MYFTKVGNFFARFFMKYKWNHYIFKELTIWESQIISSHCMDPITKDSWESPPLLNSDLNSQICSTKNLQMSKVESSNAEYSYETW